MIVWIVTHHDDNHEWVLRVYFAKPTMDQLKRNCADVNVETTQSRISCVPWDESGQLPGEFGYGFTLNSKPNHYMFGVNNE